MIFFRRVAYLIDQFNSHISDIGFAKLVIQDAVYFSLLSWRVTIFIEVATYFRYSLIDTTTRLNICLHLLFSLLYLTCFPDNYFSPVLDQSTTAIEPPHKNSHLVFYSSLSLSIISPILSLVIKSTQNDAG